jgi:hypothetical protein
MQLRPLLDGADARARRATPRLAAQSVSALVSMRYQGAVTLPLNSTPCSQSSGAVADVAGCVFTCEGSLPKCAVTCTYDPTTGLLTLTGAPGDTIVWHAWNLITPPASP